MKLSVLSACTALLASASAQLVNPSIASINGDRFVSPVSGQTVTGVRGLVTAKGPNGFWIRSTSPDRDPRTSDSVYVFGRDSIGNVNQGDIVSLNGRVLEFRSSRDFLFLTEIELPSNITVISSGNRVEAVEIGRRGLNPPTELHTSLDDGDIFGVPNNRSSLTQVNPRLEPSRYGLDFWESLSGELVTVRRPRVLNRPNRFGDTWVVGNWRTSGDSQRGGLTITEGDGNPEAILIGTALDSSANPSTSKLGDELEDITGVLTYAFGFYRILPTTAIVVTRSQRPELARASTLRSNGRCDGLTVAQYNIENVSPTSENIPDIADHIVNFLNSPDLLMLQEIQDDDGPLNTPIVSANLTMAAIRDAITAAGSSVRYNFTNINPVDDREGGVPGGNIRNVYLYNPAAIRLANLNPGSSTQATEVLSGPRLSLNPGRIDPANSAWRSTRVPLVAQWETVGDNSRRSGTFFTVNVHMSSKGGSTSLHGDARPPVNNGVESRTAQNQVVANFVRRILNEDNDAAVIVAGDFNEFAIVDPLTRFVAASGLRNMEDVVRRTETERYGYLFDMNSQALDQMYVSPKLFRGSRFDHVHLNTWVDFDSQASDHDPSLARVNVCT